MIRRTAIRLTVLLSVGAALAISLTLVLSNRGSRPPRSEGSHQLAYAAPLGIEASRRLVADPVSTRAGARPAPHACAAVNWAPSVSRSFAAVARQAGVVWLRRGGRAIVERFGRIDQNGYPTVFSVVGADRQDCRPGWLRVRVSARPNGRIGWVRSWLVRTFPVDTRIVVRLSQRRLLVYRYGKRAFSTRVAVGANQTPTPVGSFFVNERFLLSDPTGPFGVAALGVSAHSDVLRDWVQGGPIAIHGTNEPGSVGRAASHGCIRVDNRAMRRLFALTSAGTPVVIRP